MHNKLKKLLAAFAALCLVGLLLAPAAAAEDATDTVTLPAKLTLAGSLPASAGPYRFTLQAQDPANPMPAGAVGDTKTITTATAGTLDFGSITFTNIGDYGYTVKQQPGTDPDCTYDSRTYIATVYVRWQSEVGGPVTATVGLTMIDHADKLAEITFKNNPVGGVPTPAPNDGPGGGTTQGPTNTPKPPAGDGSAPGVTTGPATPPPVSATLQALTGLLPQTSDEAPLLLFAVLAGASLLALAVLLLRKHRKSKNTPQ